MYRHVCTLPAAALLAAGIAVLTPAAAWATDSGDVAALALANAGKGAGTCSQVNPAPNSLGGSAFGTSCTGNQGTAEYWCADFAKWIWQNASGSTITGTGNLDAGAVSFYNYGVDHGTLHTDPSYRPRVGDAVVYDVVVPSGKTHGTFADHVGLVTALNSDGSIETVNGDFGGVSGNGEAYFSETSTVQVKDIAAGQVPVGSAPSNIGMTISGYSSPSGLSATPADAQGLDFDW
ncbi:CHAP domain-containing protein [Actinospica robiniae]|uniref:CHAP domain-containing protein n=1 Tax=Actinospica robiniae TaxID=304901 RepID=UPI00040FEEBB|nr:CHAP domain-containing protein [Actinospica robiniae]